jgi:DNA-binding MarR family transcriptional regulator
MQNSRKQQAEALESLLPRMMGIFFGRREGDPLAQTPLGQVRLLRQLTAGPQAMTDLATNMVLSMSALTQMVHRLEEAGWVEKLADEQDRRVRHVSLTAQGDAMIRARIACRVSSAEQFLEKMDEGKVEMLIELMKGIADSAPVGVEEATNV